MHTERVDFLSLRFDRLSFEDVLSWMREATNATTFSYVVTPNVDHVVRVHQQPELRATYKSASLCVCDSQILRFLAKLSGVSLSLVRGSDLSAAIFQSVVKDGDTVAIVGSTEARVTQLKAQFPNLTFIHHEPPMSLRTDPIARQKAARFVASSGARFSLIAVGSPQQELIAYEVSRNNDAGGVGLCIGAGLDFVTGTQRRAPKFLQAAGLEWAHRLATNPRRLWKRYLVEGVRIIPIYMRWVRS